MALPTSVIAQYLKLSKKLIVKGSCQLSRANETLFASVRLVITRLASDELLALACSGSTRHALARYRQRWAIETMFGNLKTKGFALEATHLTNPDKLCTLFALLAFAVALSVKTGGAKARLCRCRHRSVLPACGWLVDKRSDDGATRHRRSDDGDLATGQARGAAASLRPRQPIQQRAVPALMADHGVVCSMSYSGNVWNNAAMESFFSSLKTERTARKMTGHGMGRRPTRSTTSSASTIQNAGTGRSAI